LKAITHDLFSVGVGLYLLVRIYGPSSPLYLLLAVWLAFITNRVIDGLGHSTRGGMSVRSFWTHSIFTAPVWGIAFAVASVYLLDVVIGQNMTASQTLFAAGLGAVLAYSHLLLDALTEGGSISGGGGSRSRTCDTTTWFSTARLQALVSCWPWPHSSNM